MGGPGDLALPPVRTPLMASTFIIVPDQLTSVLTAVNAMLGSIGETSPVTTLDPPPTTECAAALIKLSNADLMVQTKGWSWNTEEDLPLTLDTDSRAVLPDQTLRVNAAYYTSKAYLNVIQRGQYLYDRTSHVYTFLTPPRVDLVARLAWEYLPQVARQYIMYYALQQFQADYQDRSIQVRVTDTVVKDALVLLEQHEDTQANLNTVTGNVSVQQALGGHVRRRQGL